MCVCCVVFGYQLICSKWSSILLAVVCHCIKQPFDIPQHQLIVHFWKV